MNYIKRGKLLGHDWYLRIGKRVTVEGINSSLGDGYSVLFWEFDDISFDEVKSILLCERIDHRLPAIYIIQASTDRSWHAVCMSKTRWLAALSIVAGTSGIDPDYVRLAAYREHFTLRLTDKGHGKPKVYYVLESALPDDCSIGDFTSGVRYGAWTRPGATSHA